MQEYPETLMEFERQFSTDEACREYLFRLRWPEGFSCPRCGHGKAWPMEGALLRCASCAYKASVIAGTIFQGTRKPLTLWFRAIWWITAQKNGASAATAPGTSRGVTTETLADGHSPGRGQQ